MSMLTGCMSMSMSMLMLMHNQRLKAVDAGCEDDETKPDMDCHIERDVPFQLHDQR